MCAVKLSSLNKGLILDMPLKSRFEKVGDEIITNGNFSDYTGTIDDANEDTFTGWSFEESDGDAEFYAVSDAPDGYSVAVKYVQAVAPANWWNHKIYQQHFSTFQEGKTYKITFWAKASSNRVIRVRDTMSGDTSINETVSLTTSWTKYTYYTSAISVSNGIYFLFGDDSPDVYITGVSVREVKTSDLTPNQNHGIIYGATVGEDYTSFDGSDDYINLDNAVPTIGGLSNGTLSMWFKGSNGGPLISLTQGSVSSDYTFVWVGGSTETYSDESLGFMVRADNNAVLEMYVRKGENYYLDNEWHHVVVSIDGNNNKLFMDGEEQTVTYKFGSASSSYFTNIINPDTLRIGSRKLNGMDAGLWLGQICNVKIWNRALSETEIKQLYYQGREGGKIKI